MNQRLQFGLRLAVGALLVWAGVSKMLEPAAFFTELTDYKVPGIPLAVWQIVAVSLPWFEVLCGLALGADVWAESVRPVVTLLSAGFVLMVGQAVIRRLDINCGCFGGAPVWWERPGAALVRAALLLGVSFWLAIQTQASATKRA